MKKKRIVNLGDIAIIMFFVFVIGMLMVMITCNFRGSDSGQEPAIINMDNNIGSNNWANETATAHTFLSEKENLELMEIIKSLRKSASKEEMDQIEFWYELLVETKGESPRKLRYLSAAIHKVASKHNIVGLVEILTENPGARIRYHPIAEAKIFEVQGLTTTTTTITAGIYNFYSFRNEQKTGEKINCPVKEGENTVTIYEHE